MQTLGERLQEARQRLGVTLREAAEFTKIRTDCRDMLIYGIMGIAGIAILIALFFS